MRGMTQLTQATDPASGSSALAKQLPSVDMSRVASIILSGGRGTRLFPLTETRSKPATPFGGRYRLIDIPVSNSLNSHVNKLYILTQYLSASLHAHILRSYSQPPTTTGSLHILTPEETPTRCSWYQGTADAVRHHIEVFEEAPVDYFLILSGDQIYQMDFRPFVAHAAAKDADLLVASLPVEASQAQRMGVMRVDRSGRICEFAEKPEDPEPFATPAEELQRLGFPRPGARRFLASMGIYVFKKQALLDLLRSDERSDFGKHLIPSQLDRGGVYAYLYDGYWEDIGTIEAFYAANMAITQEGGPFSLHGTPFYGEPMYLAGPKVMGTQVEASILEAGSIIHAKRISHSVIGPRSRIGHGSVITHSYIIGNETDTSVGKIGSNCRIHKAIIDRNAVLGDDVALINAEGRQSYEGEGVCIRDGIIIVTRAAQIPSGFRL